MACLSNTTSRIQGFTLIEMIVVIAIVTIVGTSLSGIIRYFYRTNDYVLQEETAVANAREGLVASMSNLREASYGDDGSYPIGSAATSSVLFYSDLNGDGSVEKVQYYLSNTTLYRAITYSTSSPPVYTGQSAATSTIASYVVNATSSPIFQYYDDNGTLLTSPINIGSIASILTTLQIDVDTHRSPSTYTLLGSATLRNLRSP